MSGSQGGVPGPGGRGVPGLGRCVWSWGVHLVQGGVNLVPGRVYLVLGGCLVLGGVWFRGGLLWSGTPPVDRMTNQGGVWSRRVYLVRYSPPPVNRMTNRCKNITLPQTSFAGGKNKLAQSTSLPLCSRSTVKMQIAIQTKRKTLDFKSECNI